MTASCKLAFQSVIAISAITICRDISHVHVCLNCILRFDDNGGGGWGDVDLHLKDRAFEHILKGKNPGEVHLVVTCYSTYTVHESVLLLFQRIFI